MSVRVIRGEDDAAAAAAIVRAVRGRPLDLIDPWPPSRESEVLVDTGARGKDVAPPLVTEEGGALVGYGILDASERLPEAVLVGPVVDPARRRRGHGRALLEGLVAQARALRRKTVRAVVGSENGAAAALLRVCGFRERARRVCLRLARPDAAPEVEDVRHVRVRRANYDHADEVHRYVAQFVPRGERQTRSLLKSGDYAIVLAYENNKVVGFGEADMRYDEVATVEHLQGRAALLERGLGSRILAELIRAAVERRRVRHIDLLVPTFEDGVAEAYKAAGFERRHDHVVHELAL